MRIFKRFEPLGMGRSRNSLILCIFCKNQLVKMTFIYILRGSIRNYYHFLSKMSLRNKIITMRVLTRRIIQVMKYEHDWDMSS